MKRYGIIGNPLGHSYSEQYFTALFAHEGLDAVYCPYAIAEVEEAKELLEQLEGFNVTYPYKESIIPYLREVDATAATIGAVNVVHCGKGYNTDWIGFRDSLYPLLQDGEERALLLGTGGVSKAIQYALRDLGIDYTLVSRLGNKAATRLGYEDLDEEVMQAHTIIVNCTPLGMHPYEEEMPAIPYRYLSEKHLLYDCIYNPDKTRFLQEGKQHGCRIKNGLEMLHLQANQAWEIWKD
jgi:shikimate dehydrogenase